MGRGMSYRIAFRTVTYIRILEKEDWIVIIVMMMQRTIVFNVIT